MNRRVCKTLALEFCRRPDWQQDVTPEMDKIASFAHGLSVLSEQSLRPGDPTLEPKEAARAHLSEVIHKLSTEDGLASLSDTLPEFTVEEEMIASSVIALLDYAAFRGVDIGPAIRAKLTSLAELVPNKPGMEDDIDVCSSSTFTVYDCKITNPSGTDDVAPQEPRTELTPLYRLPTCSTPSTDLSPA